MKKNNEMTKITNIRNERRHDYRIYKYKNKEILQTTLYILQFRWKEEIHMREKLKRFPQDKIDNLNSPVSTRRTEFVAVFQWTKSQVQMSPLVSSTKHLWEN